MKPIFWLYDIIFIVNISSQILCKRMQKIPIS